jgi:putative tricarboxylic transport membrane protein
MASLEGLLHGFQLALTPINLMWGFIGVTVGTLIGVLPGIGPVTGIALLIPLTYGRNPVSALILLAGIYYGAMYGGSTTSILANIPGESSSVMTAIDGHQMAKQGRAGVALGISALGSFIAGTISVALLMLFAPVVSRWALKIGPAEFFLIMMLAFTLVSMLTGGSFLKGMISTVLGLLLSVVGIDIITGEERFTFGIMKLADGIDFIVVAIAVFAVVEVLINLEKGIGPVREIRRIPLRQMLPTREDWRRAIGPILRATGIGFFVGVLPGAGATIASFLSYGAEKALSKHPEQFGHGAIEGVAGPESANNAAVGGAMVPLLTLGIPGSSSTAVLLAAFMILGLQPGPLLFRENPDVAWSLIASMYIGNVMLLLLNLPLIGIFVQVLRLRYAIMAWLILLLSTLGVYATNNSVADLWLLLIFSAVGYFLRKADFPMPPMLLALVLGGMTEKSFRQAMILSDYSLATFINAPIPAVLTGLLLLVIGWQTWRALGRVRRNRELEEAMFDEVQGG